MRFLECKIERYETDWTNCDVVILEVRSVSIEFFFAITYRQLFKCNPRFCDFNFGQSSLLFFNVLSPFFLGIA